MLKNLPIVTKTLLIINIIFYLATMAFDNINISLTVILGSFYPESINFKFWQPLTHMFMHGGISHILFNMFALFMFGGIIERTIGQKRFLILYFSAGIGAFLLFHLQNYFAIESLKNSLYHVYSDSFIDKVSQMAKLSLDGSYSLPLTHDHNLIALFEHYLVPMVGASGAIYGVLIAFGFIYPEEKLIFVFVPFPIKAKYFIPGLMIIEFTLGITDYAESNIAHFAHLGGALTSLVLVFYWKYQIRRSH